MKIYLTILFMALTFSLFAQVDSVPSFNKREFGIDASAVNNFLPEDLRLTLSRTTMFSYRKYKSPNKFTRHNLSFDIGANFFDGVNNNGDFNFNVSYFVGWGRRRNLYKKFDWFYGNDLSFAPNISIRRVTRTIASGSMTFEDTDRNQSFRLFVGVGWFLGFQYQFNERFGLYTESRLRFLAGVSNDRFLSSSRTNSSSFTYSLDRIFILPNTLTFFYRF